MICNQFEFLNSSYGQNKISELRNYVAKNNLIITNEDLNQNSLKLFYELNSDIISTYVSNCYERLFDFYSKEQKKIIDNITTPVKYHTFTNVISQAFKNTKNQISNAVDNVAKGIGSIIDYLIIAVLIIIVLIVVYFLMQFKK